MMLCIHALQTIESDVRVNLRCRNVGVPEDGLHRAQIGTVLHHVRRAGVPQHVRAGMATRAEARLAHQLPDVLPTQTTASSA